MSKQVPDKWRRASDGTPMSATEVLMNVVEQIQRASARGKGTRLDAEQTRALDWALIRESAYDDEQWRDSSFAEALATGRAEEL